MREPTRTLAGTVKRGGRWAATVIPVSAVTGVARVLAGTRTDEIGTEWEVWVCEVTTAHGESVRLHRSYDDVLSALGWHGWQVSMEAAQQANAGAWVGETVRR